MTSGRVDAYFPWDMLRSIIGGTSAIDIPRLQISTLQEAENFLGCYGFDWETELHRGELRKLRKDAIEFIEEELLESGEAILAEVRQQTDLRRLLIWGSQPPTTERQRWTCALLRVTHTLAHCHSYFNERFGDQIRSQILARFEPHLATEDDGVYLGGLDGIPLVDFEVKPAKPVRSIAMKLLHKVENVAADVFDRIGVRFVTKERFDVLLVVKYLRENNVFMFANVKPSRSRNTLIDLNWIESYMSELDQLIDSGEMTEDERLDELRRAVRERPYPGPPHPSYNPHSSLEYHSMQFTCRHLVRVPSPADHDGRDEVRFFFPFEVQILDEESWQLSHSGLASHDRYKQRQRRTVRQRVFGSLVETE